VVGGFHIGLNSDKVSKFDIIVYLCTVWQHMETVFLCFGLACHLRQYLATLHLSVQLGVHTSKLIAALQTFFASSNPVPDTLLHFLNCLALIFFLLLLD
jgi:hypothetical protein